VAESAAQSSIGLRFLYTGRPWSPVGEVYHYRARWYAPECGRFISRDPIGYAAGPTQYGYVGGNPVMRVDPTGLDWWDDLDDSVAGGAVKGGIQGIAGFVDGVIPFVDPFEDACVYDTQRDPGTQVSQTVGQLTRDVEIALAAGLFAGPAAGTTSVETGLTQMVQRTTVLEVQKATGSARTAQIIEEAVSTAGPGASAAQKAAAIEQVLGRQGFQSTFGGMNGANPIMYGPRHGISYTEAGPNTLIIVQKLKDGWAILGAI
jgi:RHS repeat-associated protein